MRLPLFFGFIVTLVAASPAAVAAQDQPPAPSNVFRQLFPAPSGQNGYEELVRAGDLAKNSAVWQAAEIAGANLTLSEKRRLLADPAVHRALMILREGLRKPIKGPHSNGDEQELMPEFAPMRSLARLLAVELYVQFADGHPGQAIDTLADTLRFGYAIQADTMIGGLVGVAIDAIGMRVVADHMEQFSARDCDRMVSLAREWLDLPDPLIGLMQGERGFANRILAKYRNQADKLMNLVGANDPNFKRMQALSQSFKENPGAGGPAFDQAASRLSDFYDRAIAMLQKPVWERTDVDPQSDDSIAGTIVSLIAPQVGLIMDRFGREQAQVQILGIHAAIRRYRWEFNRLPESLDVLKLGKLGIDPFTGQPFTYRRTDDKTYVVSSIGPRDRSEGAAPGSRVPIK